LPPPTLGLRWQPSCGGVDCQCFCKKRATPLARPRLRSPPTTHPASQTSYLCCSASAMRIVTTLSSAAILADRKILVREFQQGNTVYVPDIGFTFAPTAALHAIYELLDEGEHPAPCAPAPLPEAPLHSLCTALRILAQGKPRNRPSLGSSPVSPRHRKRIRPPRPRTAL
jgi:hypothetical protein